METIWTVDSIKKVNNDSIICWPIVFDYCIVYVPIKTNFIITFD